MSDLRIHELKCDPDYFDAVERGDKTFELRIHDRDFRTGDYIVLRKYLYQYMDDIETVRIVFMLAGHEGLSRGYVALAIVRCTGAEDVEVIRAWQAGCIV